MNKAKTGNRRVLIALGAMLTLMFSLLAATDRMPETLQRFELDLYDMRLRYSLLNTVDDRIVIIDIDEKSLAELGRWPWSRFVLAELVEKLLGEYQVAVIGFDVFFSEADDRISLARLNQLMTESGLSPRAATSLIDPDIMLAKALKQQPVVLGSTFYPDQPDIATGQLGTPLKLDVRELDTLPIVEAKGYVGNLPILADAAQSGFFDNPLLDMDGVFRRIPLIQRYQGQYYPALSVALWHSLLMTDEIHPVIKQDLGETQSLLEALDLGGVQVPVDSRGALLVPYRGPMGSFPYFSATDILHQRVAADRLAGRIALVGTSAAALLDQRTTPVGKSYPGVEVHANLLSAFLDERFLYAPDFVKGISLTQILLLGILLSLALPALSVLTGAIFTLLLTALCVGANVYLFVHSGWVIPLAIPLMTTFWIFVLLQTAGFVQEAKTRRKLSRLFGQYVPPEVVEQLEDYDTATQLRGQSLEMTVLFSDIRGFTTLSEKLTPTELSRLMNIYLSEMTTAIHDYQGTIDKYIGDAIMAFWGAPVPNSLHAQHAVESALTMLRQIAAVNARLEAESLPPVSAGIGINTGIMAVGNMGSDFRTAYTVMGDAVNLGSRVEGLTKFYGVSLIVTESVVAQCPELKFRSLDLAQVKGKDEAVELFEPLDEEQWIAQHLDQYQTAMDAYRAGKLEDARAKFSELANHCPDDRPIQLYLERIHTFAATPVEQWTPVHKHHEK